MDVEIKDKKGRQHPLKSLNWFKIQPELIYLFVWKLGLFLYCQHIPGLTAKENDQHS